MYMRYVLTLITPTQCLRVTKPPWKVHVAGWCIPMATSVLSPVLINILLCMHKHCYRQKLLVLASTALSMVKFYPLRNDV